MEFRPLPTISDLQKFVTPDEIRGAGVKQGFFRICDAVTSKINRAGHALYQLATTGKRSEQSNEKVIGELQGIVTELKIDCDELKKEGGKLTAPEQVKAAIKYMKALDKKLHQIDDVLSHMPTGLNEETQVKLLSLALDIGTLEKTNETLQEDLRSKIGKKIHPDSLIGIQKFVQAEGKFSPVLSRLRGLITGKGWMDNPKVQKQLKTEFHSLQADIAKLPKALDRSETVAMVQRLEGIQGNAQIKLNTLKTITESVYAEEGSPEKTAKEALLSDIQFQQEGLENLKADLSSRKQLLTRQTSLSEIADKLQSITPKGGYQEIRKLKELEQNVDHLKDFLEKNPVSPDSSQVNFSKQIAEETEKVLTTAQEKIHHSELATKELSEKFRNVVATLQKDLESLEVQTPKVKLQGYAEIAKISSAIMRELNEVAFPKTDEKAQLFSEAQINASKINKEAVTKREEARKIIVKLERETIQQDQADLKKAYQEIRASMKDDPHFTENQEKTEERYNKIQEIENKYSSSNRVNYERENIKLVANISQEKSNFKDVTTTLYARRKGLDTVSEHVSLLTEEFNSLMNNRENTWRENHFTGLKLNNRLDRLLKSTKNEGEATDKNHPLYNRSQELIKRMENLKGHLEKHIRQLDDSEFYIEFFKTGLSIVDEMIDKTRSEMDKILKDQDLLVDQKVDKLQQLLKDGISAITNTYTSQQLQNMPTSEDQQELKVRFAGPVSELEKEINSKIGELSHQKAYTKALDTIESFSDGIVSAVEDPEQYVWVFKKDFVSERGDRRRDELLQAINTLQNAPDQFKDSSFKLDDTLLTEKIEQGKNLLNRYDASAYKHDLNIKSDLEKVISKLTILKKTVRMISKKLDQVLLRNDEQALSDVKELCIQEYRSLAHEKTLSYEFLEWEHHLSRETRDLIYKEQKECKNLVKKADEALAAIAENAALMRGAKEWKKVIDDLETVPPENPNIKKEKLAEAVKDLRLKLDQSTDKNDKKYIEELIQQAVTKQADL